jgi:hypothetical protein
MEVSLHPWVIGKKQLGHRPDGNDFSVSKRRDAIADGIQAGEVMANHEDRQPQRFL